MNRFRLGLVFALLLPAHHIPAADVSWITGTSGTWNDPGNWSGGAVPAESDSVTISDGGTAQLPSSVAGSYDSLLVSDAAASSGALDVSGGHLAGLSARLGNAAGSNGSATLSSGTWSNSDAFSVGESGTGTILISGGLLTTNTFNLGTLAGGVGSVTITGGTWADTGGPNIGDAGTGSLVVNGGLFTNTGGGVDLASSVGGRGTATVTSGTMITNGRLSIGSAGDAALIVNGGYVSNTDGFVGNGNYASGASGTATITSGTWNNSSSLVVGNDGHGILNVSDTGVVRVNNGTGFVSVAQQAGSTGTINIGNGGGAGTFGAGTITGGLGLARVNFNHSGSLVFAANMRGTLAVNKLGDGTTILTGSNTYSGVTTISAGVLQIGNGGANGSIASRTIVNDSSLVFNRSNAFTYGGIISGTGSVTLAGTGTISLTGNNTYTGGTTLVDGTLQINNPAVLGTSGTISLTGGTVQFTSSGTIDFSTRLSTSAGQQYKFDTNGNSIAISSALRSSGGSLVKLGTGTLSLTGSSSYTGGTTVTDGTLVISNDDALGEGRVIVTQGSILKVEASNELKIGNNTITLTNDDGSTYVKSYGTGEDLAHFTAVTSSEAGTTAEILNGTAAGDLVLTAFFASDPEVLALNDLIRIGDVLNLEGTGSNIFVLQLSYSQAEYDAAALASIYTSETDLRIGYYVGDQWVNAADGTFVDGAYTGSLVVGTYGVDTDANVVWAVLDHNSEFAVIPEPASFALGVIGLCALAVRRRRRAR